MDKGMKCHKDKHFWCADGKIFDSLESMLAGLRVMDYGTFKYHANGQKNDFSRWVCDVFLQGDLADAMEKSKTKAEAIHRLSEFLRRR